MGVPYVLLRAFIMHNAFARNALSCNVAYLVEVCSDVAYFVDLICFFTMSNACLYRGKLSCLRSYLPCQQKLAICLCETELLGIGCVNSLSY